MSGWSGDRRDWRKRGAFETGHTWFDDQREQRKQKITRAVHLHRLFFCLTGCYTGRCGTLYVHLKPDTILIGQNRDKNSRAKKVDLQALILTKKINFIFGNWKNCQSIRRIDYLENNRKVFYVKLKPETVFAGRKNQMGPKNKQYMTIITGILYKKTQIYCQKQKYLALWQKNLAFF